LNTVTTVDAAHASEVIGDVSNVGALNRERHAIKYMPFLLEVFTIISYTFDGVSPTCRR